HRARVRPAPLPRRAHGTGRHARTDPEPGVGLRGVAHDAHDRQLRREAEAEDRESAARAGAHPHGPRRRLQVRRLAGSISAPLPGRGGLQMTWNLKLAAFAMAATVGVLPAALSADDSKPITISGCVKQGAADAIMLTGVRMTAGEPPVGIDPDQIFLRL